MLATNLLVLLVASNTQQSQIFLSSLYQERERYDRYQRFEQQIIFYDLRSKQQQQQQQYINSLELSRIIRYILSKNYLSINRHNILYIYLLSSTIQAQFVRESNFSQEYENLQIYRIKEKEEYIYTHAYIQACNFYYIYVLLNIYKEFNIIELFLYTKDLRLEHATSLSTYYSTYY